MNIFAMLSRESTARCLPFLIIGGHAVNAYGYSRLTRDLDVLVNGEQRQAWLAALEHNGFSLHHDGGSFLQMNPPADCEWPLDLMLVNAPTFANLYRDAREIEQGTEKLLVPSLDGLFALKFHVLRQGIPHRGFKDLMDVLSLAQANSIDVRSDRVKSICLKYGSPEIYERILAFNT